MKYKLKKDIPRKKIIPKIKVLLCIIGCFILISIIVSGNNKLHRMQKNRESGILLAFDDYNPENWSQYFDFFEKYDVHVTFFLTGDKPIDFCYEALERGHDIAFHGASHEDITYLSESKIMENVIDPIETFREAGIELTSFAYPYGYHNDLLDEKLLQYYKIVRGAYNYELHSKADLRHGYIDAYPIDNYYLRNDFKYHAKIDRILKELSHNAGTVTCLYSHSIEAGDWCVTKEHLEYLFKKAKKLGLKFYTFSELQFPRRSNYSQKHTISDVEQSGS